MPESYMGSRSQSHVTRQKRACMKVKVQQVYCRASLRLALLEPHPTAHPCCHRLIKR